MVFGFYFNKQYTILRRKRNGTTSSFITNGISRMEYSSSQEKEFSDIKCFFIFSPAVKIRIGDIVDDGTCKIQIGKVTEVIDIDGYLSAYRCESI